MNQSKNPILIVVAFFSIYVIWGSTYLLNKIAVSFIFKSNEIAFAKDFFAFLKENKVNAKNIKGYFDTKFISNYIRSSDIIFTSAGRTTFETASFELPSIVDPLAKHYQSI